MRAAQINDYGPASKLNVVEVDTPSITEDQLLVKIGAAGVNPVDTYIRTGTNNYSTTFPHTPGLDGSGTVVQVGGNVSEFKEGDRVYFNRNLTGSAAEYAVCSPTHTFALADSVSFNEGACLGIPYTTAYRALFDRANAKAGQRVLIHGGTGAVGIAAVQLALAAGLDVVASTSTTAGEALLKEQGVQQVIKHNDVEHLVPFQTTPPFNESNGFDIIIEMLANQNLDQDLKTLNPGGRVIIVGNRGTVEINPRDLMARDAAVLGMSIPNIDLAGLKRIAKAIQPLLQAKLLKPVVRKTYSLEELPQAHEDVLESGALGNLVIDLSA